MSTEAPAYTTAQLKAFAILHQLQMEEDQLTLAITARRRYDKAVQDLETARAVAGTPTDTYQAQVDAYQFVGIPATVPTERMYQHYTAKAAALGAMVGREDLEPVQHLIAGHLRYAKAKLATLGAGVDPTVVAGLGSATGGRDGALAALGAAAYDQAAAIELDYDPKRTERPVQIMGAYQEDGQPARRRPHSSHAHDSLETLLTGFALEGDITLLAGVAMYGLPS